VKAHRAGRLAGIGPGQVGAAGLSQAELAGRAGLSLRSIQNWEQGHRRPKADALLAMSKPLKVSVETLVALVAGRAEAPAHPAREAVPPRSEGGKGKGKPRGRKAKGG
jgi:transcriptional regulator with XRE-family HTH domain